MIRSHAAWLLVACMLAISTGTNASAHSLDSLQESLFERENYFQIVNQPAPDFSFQDAEGKPVSLADLRGKIVVLHFVFASCPDVCPLHAEKLADVQDMINATPMRDRVMFVTVTTDPERDTPEVMKAYGPARGLDPANWLFLTSGPERPEDTRRLAEAFNNRFVPTEDGLQIHSTVTHVIDGEGQWRGNFHGLKFEPTNLVLFINGLMNANVPHEEPEPPSYWERFWSLF